MMFLLWAALIWLGIILILEKCTFLLNMLGLIFAAALFTALFEATRWLTH